MGLTLVPTIGKATYTEVVDSLLNELSDMDAITMAVPQPVKEPTPVVKAKCGAKQKLFSAIWGIVPPHNVDFAVDIYTPKDWPEVVRGFIPKRCPTYMVNPESAEAATYAITHNERAIAIGPTGAGKSHLWREVCARLCIPFYRIQLHEELEYSAVFGMPKLSASGELTFAPGPIVLMAKNGGVLCLDELYRANSDLNMSLQYVLEDEGKVYLPDFPGNPEDRLITPVSTFRIVATDNTEGLGDSNGRHVTGRRQDTAFLDRWTMTIRVPYTEAEMEIKRLRSVVPKLTKKDATLMLKLTTLVRVAYSQESLEITISPRTLVSWANKALKFNNPVIGLKYAWFNKLPEDDVAEAKALVIKVYGNELGAVL